MERQTGSTDLSRGGTIIRVCVESIRVWLQHRHLPWVLAILAMLLCSPALRLGWIFDDDFHRAALTRPDIPTISRSPAELFVFIEGNKAANSAAIAMGWLPWWTQEDLRLAFYRPLTGLTHWVDYELWAKSPLLMHLHSLLWFGSVVAVAALFYRRMLGCTWVAGLAALMFAVDDAHGLPAAWIANRNALIGAFFGLLTLIAHDRWRRDGGLTGAILAPLMLLAGVLAKESTAAIGAYLVAYALFLDRGRWARRFLSLLPCTLIGIVWWVAYRHYGYGVAGSAWYLDPGANIAEFARIVAARAPNLLAWQWLVPADLEWSLSSQAARTLWLTVMVFLVLIAAVLAPLIRRDPVARFWTVGMLLALVPACAVYPSARLLFFVGIGGMGLLAQLLAAILRNEERMRRGTWLRLPARVLCAILIVIHLGLAPRALARMPGLFKEFDHTLAQAEASIPSDAASLFQTVLLVNTPTFSMVTYSGLKRVLNGTAHPVRAVVLGSGIHPTEVSRPDENTLLIRPEQGFLAPVRGTRRGQELKHVLFNPGLGFFSLDRLFCSSSSMEVGKRIKLFGLTAEVTALTDDGRPGEAAFHFPAPFENPVLRWMQWSGGKYVPFVVPAVGETVRLPATNIPMLGAVWSGQG
ncbi:MAG: hypothetical protein JSU63_00310 [Phycisphaerales bacterium]|nr:MAG: hypothetical protein JSU63_00310 [Phycisphaerales bacterium]